MAKARSISLGDDAQERLEELRKKARANTASEVVRNALRYYEFLVEQSLEGTEFYYRKKDEQPTRMMVM
jgi:Arc/MetJ-type ribon-helix-helix transcriptional regulator